MQRRSSGLDDGDDFNNLPVSAAAAAAVTSASSSSSLSSASSSASSSSSSNPIPSSASNFLSYGLECDAAHTAQATSAQALARPVKTPTHHHNTSRGSDGRRTSFDTRSQSTRSRRSGNFSTWKSTTSQNGSVEKAPLALSVDPPAGSAMGSKSEEDSDDVDKVPDSSGVLRRPRSRSPWAIGLFTLLVSIIGLGMLATILNSSATRCLDVKGCIMSYMRPSYHKLSDFDTEHTRFGSKYSLYLYREQEVDEDIKVRGLDLVGPGYVCPSAPWY